MLHSTYLGFFDRDALQRRQLAVVKPLDIAIVRSKLERIAQFPGDGMAYIGKDRFSLSENFLRCLDFVQTRESALLMAEIAADTGCDILFLETGELLTPQELVKWFEEMDALRRQRRERSQSRRSRRGHSPNNGES
jgi:hypothetical protein